MVMSCEGYWSLGLNVKRLRVGKMCYADDSGLLSFIRCNVDGSATACHGDTDR